MSRLKKISNSNKNIEEKVNFFIDCVNDFIDHPGFWSFYEIETPLTAVNKILFQIKHNKNNCVSFVDNYIQKSWFSYKPLLKKYASYKLVENDIDRYLFALKANKNQSKPIRKKIITSEQFGINLEAFHSELKEKMTAQTITDLISFLKCGHTIFEEEHDKAIRLYANLICSEYFQTGRSTKEIRDIINNVFSRDIKKFPFAENVKTIRQKTAEIAKSDLKQQLLGFQNAFSIKPKKDLFFIRIFGAAFPSEFKFTYNNVTFLSHDHSDLEQLRRYALNQHEDFFERTDCFIAKLKVEYYSYESVLDNAVVILRPELDYLEGQLGQEFRIDKSRNFLSSDIRMKKFGYSRYLPNNTIIHKHKLNDINNHSFYIFRKNRSNAVTHFLAHEPFFLTGWKNRSITEYWQYLESILNFGESNGIQHKVSHIILNGEKEFIQDSIIAQLINSLNIFNGGSEILGISFEELQQVIKGLRRKRLSRHLKNCNYPFIKQLVDMYTKTYTADDFISAQQYYEGILIETREYRNLFVHNGKVNKEAEVKLKYSFPIIVTRFRWLLFDTLSKNAENQSFEEIIDRLYNDGIKKTKK